MTQVLQILWYDFFALMLQRPKRMQVAALCYRGEGIDKEVLLVTSRGTGRWIIPKGWPMRGKNAAESARQEAWEEAGVIKGETNTTEIGRYTYDKTKASGWSYPVETIVYPLEVEALSKTFPEAHQRKRKWVKTSDAASLLQESELQAIVRQF
ncbi:MAG: NUDIX hydrolase [Pseudoruegeria sp.]